MTDRISGIFAAIAIVTSLSACASPASHALDEANGATPAATAQPAAPPPSAKLDPLAAEVVRLTNIERQKHGVAPLAVSGYLNQSGQFHADVMARQGCNEHACPGEPELQNRMWNTGYQFIRAAENIAWGWPSPDAVVRGWMNSAGHRRNILDPQLTEIGIGVVTHSSGRFWVQNFGRPMDGSFGAMHQDGNMNHQAAVPAPAPVPGGAVPLKRIPGLPSPPAADSRENASYFATLANDARSKNGMGPLAIDPAMNRVLQERAVLMARLHCSEKECPDDLWTTDKLEEAGIRLSHVRAMFLWGPEDAKTVFEVLKEDILTDPRHNAVGIGYGRHRDENGEVRHRWIVMTGILD